MLGVLFGTQAFVRHLRRRGGEGVLVNVSSGAARKPYAGWSVYCAAKAAVDRMTECVALEEAAHGLRAYALAPGVIDTDMQALIRATPAARFPERPALPREEARRPLQHAPLRRGAHPRHRLRSRRAAHRGVRAPAGRSGD